MLHLAWLNRGIYLYLKYINSKHVTNFKYLTIIFDFSIHNTIYNDGGYDPNGLIGSANQVAKMRILEVGRNVKQVSEVKLGDELELRIDVNQPYSIRFVFIIDFTIIAFQK